MSFLVTQPTRETGIRWALGATSLSTVWLVLGDALVMIAAGTAIALPCVWAFDRLLNRSYTTCAGQAENLGHTSQKSLTR